ncbi:MAG: glycosyltransferase domain-containing protein [Saprospiraceae bacterium]
MVYDAKKVIYTAIFGQKDELKLITPIDGIDYILFTDDPNIKSEVFTVKFVPAVFEDPTRNARFYKIMSHQVIPDYHYSLWIDANIQSTHMDIHGLFDQYLMKHDLAVHLHPERDCIYDEAAVCIEINKDAPATILSQMEKYQNLSYPTNNGLISSSIIFRRNTTSVEQVNEAWWKELDNHSRRDQLSFPYVCDLLNFEFYPVSGHVRTENVDGFTLFPHKKRKSFLNW